MSEPAKADAPKPEDSTAAVDITKYKVRRGLAISAPPLRFSCAVPLPRTAIRRGGGLLRAVLVSRGTLADVACCVLQTAADIVNGVMKKLVESESDFLLPLEASFHDTENFYLVTVRCFSLVSSYNTFSYISP